MKDGFSSDVADKSLNKNTNIKGNSLVSSEKKVCLVTGGTGGIGSAICKRLSGDGFIVIATCRPEKESKIGELHQGLFANDSDIHVYPMDVSSFQSCGRLVSEIEQRFGPISILINNAGITRDSSMKKMDHDQWNDVISVNLSSVFNVSKLVFESMCNQRWGRIVNIASINGQKGQFGQGNYAASKAGILGFTKSLALEGARFGVTVNSVSPGYIGTKMVTELPEDVLNSIISQIPVGRLGTADEISSVISFLTSDTSGFITGSNIAVNGGQHMF